MDIELKEMLERHEGRKRFPYHCTADKYTIGIGHNIDAKGLPDHINAYLDRNGFIKDDMIDELLEQDVQDAIDDCRRLYPFFLTFSDVRQYALIDFLFNVGYTTAATFKNTNRAINEERWEDAADNFEKSLWYKQVKNRAVEIVGMIREG
jgi:lysozyme